VARAAGKSEAFEQSCRDRKRIEMLFAHLQAYPSPRSPAAARATRRARRVHPGGHCPKPTSARQARRATTANRGLRPSV